VPADVVSAPAKLTVSLRITGVRPDGYHLIDAEMVSVDLCDELAFAEGDGLEIVGATGLPVLADEDNLVRRALQLAGSQAQVTLTKRIPAGAGLGGGSADAAAVLRWAGFRDRPPQRPSALTCRSACEADGPGSPASARRSSRCRTSTAHLHLAHSAPRLRHPGGLPLVGPAGWPHGAGPQRPGACGARPRARTGPVA
jgi:hypothetical protein